MAFRQPNSDASRPSQEWHIWNEQHRAELLAIGLPDEVNLDAARWSDFLENGHLHRHESSGFEFGRLSPGHIRPDLRSARISRYVAATENVVG